MENLNAEQIIKAFEVCRDKDLCNECPYEENIDCLRLREKHAIALMKSQEQKIFELENRLKECENGYEGTLYLERCKLHDAEEKVKELTEENERLRGCIKSKEEVEAIMRATYEPLVKEITKEQIDKAVTDTVRQMRPAILEEVISAVDKMCDRQIYDSKWVDENLEEVAFTDVGYAIDCWENCIKPELMKKFEEKKVDQIAEEMLNDGN